MKTKNYLDFINYIHKTYWLINSLDPKINITKFFIINFVIEDLDESLRDLSKRIDISKSSLYKSFDEMISDNLIILKSDNKKNKISNYEVTTDGMKFYTDFLLKIKKHIESYNLDEVQNEFMINLIKN